MTEMLTDRYEERLAGVLSCYDRIMIIAFRHHTGGSAMQAPHHATLRHVVLGLPLVGCNIRQCVSAAHTATSTSISAATCSFRTLSTRHPSRGGTGLQT